jgi:hypothetical protein
MDGLGGGVVTAPARTPLSLEVVLHTVMLHVEHGIAWTECDCGVVWLLTCRRSGKPLLLVTCAIEGGPPSWYSAEMDGAA